MIKFKLLAICLGALFLFSFTPSEQEDNNKVRILLIGDSTTAGGKGQLENNIENLLASEVNIPPLEIINLGKGGDTAYKLLETGRYDKEVAPVDSVYIIFLRYGINDWFQRQPLAENFPKDMAKVIARLRQDHQQAKIIVMTIIPFLDDANSRIVNELNKEVAKSENLALFDIYPAYKAGLEKYGQNSMNQRLYPLAKVPVKYHSIIKPYTSYLNWKKAEYVSIKNTDLDPLLGHLPNWYGDRHPNTMGYNLIARETAKYLLSILQKEE